MNYLKYGVMALIGFAVNTQAQTGSVSFQIEPVTTCESPGPCELPTSYAVYSQGSTVALVTSSGPNTQAVPFHMDIGTEYCWEATATNSGGESGRSLPVCYTPVTSVPGAPVILSIPVEFN